ncbi:hypothetical protein CPAV1605_312 [seawater metagenome]|uniref:Uncharacterized protein n=1 Tax=seawater metagenome TaxID=1561972 RepID=A0A5E8CHQ8_9ZZZZ
MGINYSKLLDCLNPEKLSKRYNIFGIKKNKNHSIIKESDYIKLDELTFNS